jgi:hypothetical protein
VLIQLLTKYVWGQLGLANFGNEIIRVEKSKLLSVECVQIFGDFVEFDESFSMPHVKSLGNARFSLLLEIKNIKIA